ncbi:MAG: hypothetical protein PHF00_08025 [Elusimicrobia bacterium]|nr:hypothetical protein [Elusimicrobiota bacterium]
MAAKSSFSACAGVLVCGSFLFGLNGCTATDGDFARARSLNTSEAYSEFISRHPSSSLRGQAEKALEKTAWRQAESEGTAAAYLAFLKLASAKNQNIAPARERCRRLLAEGKGREEDYFGYLRRFGDEPSASELRRALAKIRFDGLSEREGELFSLQYPGTPEAEKISAALRRRDFQEAEQLDTRLAYAFFLKRHPEGAEARKARGSLERFAAAADESGNAEDLERLLPRLRRASARLRRMECRNSVSASIRGLSDVFSAEAEELRGRLRQLEGNDIPAFCSERAAAVGARNRRQAANAVHALARLMERQQQLASEFSGPDGVAADARDIGERAAGLAEASEIQELELEALYGSMPADPKRPEDTASRNAREAERRAKRAWELAHGSSKSGKKEAGEVLRLMDRQADLLVDIIAYLEQP